LKKADMIKWCKDITEFEVEEHKYILYILDALIKNVKLKSIA